MGDLQSKPNPDEQAKWSQSHSIQTNTAKQQRQIPKLLAFKKTLYLMYTQAPLGLESMHVKFRHYIVTDGFLVLEMGDGASSDASVNIHPNTYDLLLFFTEKEFELTDTVRARMEDVCGAQGHSWGLRNSEHFAKYIATGSWVSSQLFPNSSLWTRVAPYMTPEQKQLINSLPDEIKAKRNRLIRPLFYNGQSFVKYTDKKSILTQEEADNAINILLVGPTGSGKSHIINLPLNKVVCPSSNSTRSVTRHMDIIQGTVIVGDSMPECRRVNLIDSIGLCDSELSPEEVISVVKQHIKSTFVHLDKVILVCANGRLEKAHYEGMRKIMKWLKYESYPFNFSLVFTKADLVQEEEREQLLAEVCNDLGMGWHVLEAHSLLPSAIFQSKDVNSHNVVPLQIAVGFPPQATYGETEDELLKLLDVVFTRPSQSRIPVDASSCPLL